MADSNFIDYVKIYCRSGNGGSGSTHMRREKYVPKGGPDGGDGGRGGHIILRANPQFWTLIHLKYRKHIMAEHGGAGSGQLQHGKNGADIILDVPLGTVAKNAETGEVLFELVEPDEQRILVKGGRGGLGNNNFKTATNQTPRYSQPGEPYEEGWFILELMWEDLDIQQLTVAEPVTVCVSRPARLPADENLLPSKACRLTAFVSRSAHKSERQPRNLPGSEHPDYRHIQFPVTYVCEGSDPGPVAPLIRISDGDEGSFSLQSFSVNFHHISFRCESHPSPDCLDYIIHQPSFSGCGKPFAHDGIESGSTDRKEMSAVDCGGIHGPCLSCFNDLQGLTEISADTQVQGKSVTASAWYDSKSPACPGQTACHLVHRPVATDRNNYLLRSFPRENLAMSGIFGAHDLVSHLLQIGHDLQFPAVAGYGIDYEQHHSKIVMDSSYTGVSTSRKSSTLWKML